MQNGMSIFQSKSLEIKADANNKFDRYWWTAKKECNKQCKPSMLQDPPNPRGISLGDMQLHYPSRIISIWMGGGEKAEKGEINGM